MGITEMLLSALTSKKTYIATVADIVLLRGHILIAGVVVILALTSSSLYAGSEFGDHPGVQDPSYFCSRAIKRDVEFELGYERQGELVQIIGARDEFGLARVIVNEDLVYRLPPSVVALELFSACGRIRFRDLPPDEPRQTFDADCWAASTLRGLGYWSRRDFEETVEFFLEGRPTNKLDSSRPSSGPSSQDRPSSQQRAKNLYVCAG